MKRIASWKFGDTKKEADYLIGLVIFGKKRATSSLYNSYINKKEALPKIGEKSIIKDSRNRDKCLIVNTKVRVVSFGKVSKTFAFKEGEGDRSLKHWREVHKRFFNRRLRKMGREFNEDILVVCQEFKVLKVFD